MKKILKSNKNTKKFLEKLPTVWFIGCWAKVGKRPHYFSGRYDKKSGLPLVYFYDDHNGTCDNYYLIPIDNTTTGEFFTYTFNEEEADALVEYYTDYMNSEK